MKLWQIPAIALLVAFSACSTTRAEGPKTAGALSWTVQELVMAARDASTAATKSQKRGDMKELALAGVDYANRCLERAPEEAACYYYRAINTGLYYQARVIGYQTGVKQMIEDCERVIALDAGYDRGGTYRILGQLFTKLPQTTGRPDSVTRDLEKAEGYLNQALSLAPEYPENHLFLAETLLAQGRYAESLDALARAKQLVPQWKNDRSYSEWKSTTDDLEKQLAKAID